jgi:hypothetical protein
VVDAEDVIFVESGEQYLVQFVRRRAIVPERLFDDNAGAACAAGIP